MTEIKVKIEQLLKKYELPDYKWVNPADVVVSQWVRVKCNFGCSDYGLGTCPPNVPEVSECREFFQEYQTGLIVKLKVFADKNAYPSDWSGDMTKKLLNLEREIFLLGNHKVFLLNQTCCNICQDCTGSRIQCKDKRRSRPSPEAFAVDVYETVRKAGFSINVINENPSQINRFAFVLIN